MKLIKEIDIIHNKKIVFGLNMVGILLFFPFMIMFSILAINLKDGIRVAGTFDILGIGFAFLLYFVLLAVHELVHGIFFKLFKPEKKVVFGIAWKSGLAYATSPGSHYSRFQMLAIGLAPFVILTSLLTLLFMVNVLPLFLYVFLVSLHVAGCVGDFYYVYLLLFKFRGQDILVEDTEIGLRIYQA